MRKLQTACLSTLAIALAACQTGPQTKSPVAAAPAAADPAAILSGSPAAATASTPRMVSPYAPAQEDLSTRGDYVAGGLYKPGVKDSITGIEINADLIPEPEVVALPRSRYGNMAQYSVLGKQYNVLADTHGYREEGTASYYGKKFHGRRTSAQEVYDMYAFSAAHKTLPIPSFARVTNLDNGKSVVVRINDRGPFHEGRVIDLSLAAATKIGIVARGTGRVSVVALQPDTAAPASVAATVPVPQAVSAAAAQPSTVAVDTRPAFRPDAARFVISPGGNRAEQFDAFLKENKITIATGQPMAVVRDATVANVTATPTATVTTVVTAPVAAVVLAEPAAGPGEVILQVASFASQTNAHDALAKLAGAGIAGVRLIDGYSAAGARIWRLRVGPVANGESDRLIQQIASLGLGHAQRVL